MVFPLGSPTGSPWVIGTLWVHGLVGPRKWLVYPESMMDLLSLVGLLAGTKCENTDCLDLKSFMLWLPDRIRCLCLSQTLAYCRP